MFWLAREEKGYNPSNLPHHRLAEGQIYGDFASKEATAAMASEDPNFVDQQGALYESTCNAHAGCNTVMVEAATAA